jgi:hypothetical protein
MPNASAMSSRLWLAVTLKPLAASEARNVRHCFGVTEVAHVFHPLLERNRGIRACAADPSFGCKGL